MTSVTVHVHTAPEDVRRYTGEGIDALEIVDDDCRVTIFLNPEVRRAIVTALNDKSHDG